MPADRFGPSFWMRGFALVAVVLIGLVTIVGSGGGGSPGFLGSICDTYPDSCKPPPPPPPSVAIEPPSVTAQVGAAVSFEARTANTSGALTYQWRRSSDGGVSFADIGGATDKHYALAGVNLADDGAVLMAVVRQDNGVVVQATSRLTVSVTPGVVYADGDFAPDTWQSSPASIAGSPQFTHEEERIDDGGNPGAFRKMTTQVAPGSGSSRVLHLSLSSSYDPRLQGAISTIDYAEDCSVFSASDINYVESGIFIEQDGRRYVADAARFVCTLRQWTGSARPSLRQQDFRQFDGPACNAGDNCPDFSAAGSMLRFGFERNALTTPGGSVVHGIDNWKVTVWRR